MQDSNLAENPETINDEAGNLPITQQKVRMSGRILAACQEAGISIPEASKALGFNKDYAYHVAKIAKCNDVANPIFHRLAARRIKSLLKMEPIIFKDKVLDRKGELVETIHHFYPKHGDSLGAAKEVLDRTQPKQQQIGSASISFIQINVDGYKCR